MFTSGERRHTIDFDEVLPNLKHPSVVLEKRATQASPDSLYSSFESLIQRKQSKTDYHQKYEGLNKEVRNYNNYVFLKKKFSYFA